MPKRPIKEDAPDVVGQENVALVRALKSIERRLEGLERKLDAVLSSGGTSQSAIPTSVNGKRLRVPQRL